MMVTAYKYLNDLSPTNTSLDTLEILLLASILENISVVLN